MFKYNLSIFFSQVFHGCLLVFISIRNNTNIASSLISVNKIFLFLSLFNVLFFLKDNVSKNNRQFLVSILFSSTILLTPFDFFFQSPSILSRDAEVNPGHNCKPNKALTICHWNLNSRSTHNFAKLHLLKAYVTVHKFDTICFSETYLHSTIPIDNNNLEIYLHQAWRKLYLLQKFTSFKSLRYKSFR